MKNNFFRLFLSVFILIVFSSCDFFSANEKSKIEEKLSPGVDGVQKKYRDDKTLLSTIEHKDGKRHGISRSYYEDGKTVQNEIRYTLNVKNGITNSYYKNKQLYSTVEYINGKREGILKKYYNSGELMAEVPYKDGDVQPGLIEYQKSGEKKTIYPDILFEEIDLTELESKYIIRVKLSEPKNSVKFTQILFDDFGNELAEKRLIDYDGIANIIIYIRQNNFVQKKIKVRAEFKTFLGNPFVSYKEKIISIQR